jgi:hypothetical protein
MNERLTTSIHIDASNNAIGAYLFQVKNNKEIRFRFMLVIKCMIFKGLRGILNY